MCSRDGLGPSYLESDSTQTFIVHDVEEVVASRTKVEESLGREKLGDQRDNLDRHFEDAHSLGAIGRDNREIGGKGRMGFEARKNWTRRRGDMLGVRPRKRAF